MQLDLNGFTDIRRHLGQCERTGDPVRQIVARRERIADRMARSRLRDTHGHAAERRCNLNLPTDLNPTGAVQDLFQMGAEQSDGLLRDGVRQVRGVHIPNGLNRMAQGVQARRDGEYLRHGDAELRIENGIRRIERQVVHRILDLVIAPDGPPARHLRSAARSRRHGNQRLHIQIRGQGLAIPQVFHQRRRVSAQGHIGNNTSRSIDHTAAADGHNDIDLVQVFT